MKILKAKWILTCDEKFKIHRDKAVVFDEKIEEIFQNYFFFGAPLSKHSERPFSPGLLGSQTSPSRTMHLEN